MAERVVAMAEKKVEAARLVIEEREEVSARVKERAELEADTQQSSGPARKLPAAKTAKQWEEGKKKKGKKLSKEVLAMKENEKTIAKSGRRQNTASEGLFHEASCSIGYHSSRRGKAEMAMIDEY